MKINLAIFALIMISIVFITLALDKETIEQKSFTKIDDFTLSFLSGEQENLSTIINEQDVIIHFWASWCAPCLNEFPDLMTFAETYKDNVKIIAVAVQNKPEDINKFISGLSKPLPENVYIATDENWNISKKIFNTYKLPESFYLDRHLNILARHNGAQENWLKSPWIREFINKNIE